MEESLNISINKFDKPRDITYQNFIQQQKYDKKSNNDRLEIFKQKLKRQNFFEENDDVNIIHHSTK
jgi:hypothetical protein